MMDFDNYFDDDDNHFNPFVAVLMCHLLKQDIMFLNDRIDITTKPTYFFINDAYFYSVLLALHINENARYIKKSGMPLDELVHIIEKDTYLKMTGGKDID